jgi:endo-1,4-beta-xylanase
MVSFAVLACIPVAAQEPTMEAQVSLGRARQAGRDLLGAWSGSLDQFGISIPLYIVLWQDRGRYQGTAGLTVDRQSPIQNLSVKEGVVRFTYVALGPFAKTELALKDGRLVGRVVLPAGFVDPDTSQLAGTQYKTFHSRTINGPASYQVYLPPDYGTAQTLHYPVVYFLHGLGGDQHSMGSSIVPQLDAAIRADQSPAMIVVGVNGLRDSRYYDSYDGQRPVEKVIVQDLIAHIDATYRTLSQRQFRAVEGFSMGGFGAAHLGFKYPELFGAVSVLAGALLDDAGVASAPDLVTTPELFAKDFGSSVPYFHAGSPWTLVRENADRIRGRTLVRIGVGDKDGLLQRDTRYHELLKELRIEHEFFTVPGVGHEEAKFYKSLGSQGFEFYRKAWPARITH